MESFTASESNLARTQTRGWGLREEGSSRPPEVLANVPGVALALPGDAGLEWARSRAGCVPFVTFVTATVIT